ncbi:MULTISPECIES: entericidin A/B family lipoprotein [Jeongeupia]|uniref:Entericidin A/B family lipoprotein n=1 Tax=Jeongeupia naejangsanensis TaxID=613195 RepID=A0ABS2BJ00_9NEIS|nr:MULTISPECIES: entericidin A/B family lipoprotein [Jeongeupia]MBM3115590.1 entericidin A/B family lipoprotein [Jeongeupia naejangsanensis]
MKSIFLLAVVAALTLSGCNTMKGFGQDVQKVGGKIENAGSK